MPSNKQAAYAISRGPACKNCTEFGTKVVIPKKKLYRKSSKERVYTRIRSLCFSITFFSSSVIEGKVLAVEHFTANQIYIENRSANRVVNERVWSIYETHHSAMESNGFDAELACKDLEKEMQFALDQATKFDYDVCMNQFERVFENHVRKIPSYIENLKHYDEKNIYFLIEFSSWFIERYSKMIKCRAVRMDDGIISLSGNGIIITTRMLEILKRQIGVLEGVILQSYSSLDLNMAMKSMIYLDLTSEENLEKSINEQEIEIYKKYFLEAPKVNIRFNLEDA